MPPDDADITPGEVFRIVEKMQGTLENIWRELKEIRAGFVPLREFEDYKQHVRREIEQTAATARDQINGVARSLREGRIESDRLLQQQIDQHTDDIKEIREGSDDVATRRWSFWASIASGVVGAGGGAAITEIVAKH